MDPFSGGVILSVAAFQAERRIWRAGRQQFSTRSVTRPNLAGIRDDAPKPWIRSSGGVILSVAAFQAERRIWRADWQQFSHEVPHPAEPCRNSGRRAETVDPFLRGVILSVAAFQAERRIWRADWQQISHVIPPG